MQDLVVPTLGTLALAAVGGYLLGSIPFGVILTRLVTGEDVRSIGSGNIGATNVLRTGRKDLALATLILDAGKGAAAFLIAQAGAAFLGHLFPVWLGFKGGKGVATFMGLLLAASWPLGLMAIATWLIVAVLFRMSSFAALVAALASPLLALLPLPLAGLPASAPVLALAVASAFLIWLRHHENIARILKGTEPRIGAKAR